MGGIKEFLLGKPDQVVENQFYGQVFNPLLDLFGDFRSQLMGSETPGYQQGLDRYNEQVGNRLQTQLGALNQDIARQTSDFMSRFAAEANAMGVYGGARTNVLGNKLLDLGSQFNTQRQLLAGQYAQDIAGYNLPLLQQGMQNEAQFRNSLLGATVGLGGGLLGSTGGPYRVEPGTKGALGPMLSLASFALGAPQFGGLNLGGLFDNKQQGA